MNLRRFVPTTVAVASIVGLSLSLAARADDPPPQPQPDGVEVQARGPVHEAFAEPVNVEPVPGPVAPKAPPEPIEEAPPDQKPDGDNVQWIPGYWSWDDDQKDYLWISGFWRVPPPGRRWVPGHWQQLETGWQWVGGMWNAETIQEVKYLPPPPPSIEAGASTPAPDATSVYIPGCWEYRETRYLWRPGHWTAYRPHWVWRPACYHWTPSGCLFVDGYWDHPLDERGLLFAPVRFTVAWGNRRFYPQIVVNTDFLLGALFVRTSWHHYYFGDYFEPRFATRGFVAWPDYRWGKVGLDPNFIYYRRLHATDVGWEAGLRELYRGRLAGEVPRPPHTWGAQLKVVNTIRVNKTENVFIHKNISLTHVQNVTALTTLKEINTVHVTNLASLGRAHETVVTGRTIKMETVGREERAREVKAATQMREIAITRREVEGKMLIAGGVPVHHTDPPKVVKFEMPKVVPHVVEPRPPVKVVPPLPVYQKHEEKAIPHYEPPAPPKPHRP